ncbi:MAG: extracellular solute-binding protein [Steroidobacteraceae bacterium]
MNTKFLSSRRRVLKSVIAASVAPLAFPAIARSRSELVVQSFGGLYEKTLREEVIPGFESTTGIKVTLAIENDRSILPKLAAARRRAPFDVCICDNNIAFAGKELGVWAPDQSASMPNIPAIYESCRPPTTANYSSIIYEYALVHNKKKLPNPTSWRDLWADGLIVGVPHVTQAIGMTFLYIAAILHGGDAHNLDPGFAAIKRLYKFRVYRSVGEGLSLFQQGEVDAALYYGHRAQQMIDLGLDVGKVRPKEGIWGQRTGAQIPRVARNIEGARAWVNNTLSVAYQTAFAKSLYSPTNRNVVLPPPLAAKNVMGQEHVDSIQEVDWKVVMPRRDKLMDQWRRELR